MKRVICFCLIGLFGCSFDSHDKLCNDIPVNQKIVNLFKIEGNHILLSDEEETGFFCSLPTDFNEFVFVYSHPHTFKNQKLWLSLDYHFEKYLPKLKTIDKYQVLERLFRLGKGGQWSADYVSLLQKTIQSEYAIYIDSCIDVLEGKSQNEILSFWRFYFDGPHPESYKEDFKVLYTRYAEKDQRIADLMKQSYEQLLKESDGHGQ